MSRNIAAWQARQRQAGFTSEPVNRPSNQANINQTWVADFTGPAEITYIEGTVTGSLGAWGLLIGTTPNASDVFTGGGFPAGRFVQSQGDTYPKVVGTQPNVVEGTTYEILVFTESNSDVQGGVFTITPA